MSLARIRDEYRVLARLGARVHVDPLDRDGLVIGNLNDYVAVNLGAPHATIYIHPDNLTWK